MRIGEFSRRVGLTPPTVRYYESLGLLEHAGRVSGSRRYGPAALDSVRVVLALKSAGFTLAQIKTFVTLDARDRTPERWQKEARQKLAELDQSIAELRAARALLAKSLDCACRGRVNDCALLRHSPGTEGRRPARRPARGRPARAAAS